MTPRRSIALVALLFAGTGATAAHAALIGVNLNQSFPDVTLGQGQTTLIYDSNRNNTGIGRLTVVAWTSSLATATGGPSTTQTYATDAQPYEEMFTIDIDSLTGAFVGGTVSINVGNASTPRFSWTGNLTNFGFATDGRVFDATWSVTADQYLSLPPAFSSLTDGALTGLAGGIYISNSLGMPTGSGFSASMTGANGNFNRDWIIGNAPTSTVLNTFLSTNGITLTSPVTYTTTTIKADVFVPLPGGLLLLASGLGGVAPWWRRRRGRDGAAAAG